MKKTQIKFKVNRSNTAFKSNEMLKKEAERGNISFYNSLTFKIQENVQSKPIVEDQSKCS